jgi:formamidopyrimidine-DNA glycosylase
MLEIPESRSLANQVNESLTGKKINNVVPASSKHKLAFYSGDPAGYPELLKGRRIISAHGHGMFVDVHMDGDIKLTICDGTNMRLYPPHAEVPEKNQLLIRFDDGCFIALTVAMYGGIWVYSGMFENKYHLRSINSVDPLSEAFDARYFDGIFRNTGDISMKALLATEQRIPGLGNGVLQDILFNARIHPKRKKSTLSDFHLDELFHSLKVTLQKMTDEGGRNTEKDLFGVNGQYKTLMSKNTLHDPCLICGGNIVKEPYMGGAVYFCPVCQKLK